MVVFGDVDDCLYWCVLGEYVIDYFDKLLGFLVLGVFICGYVSL